jgi:hypothetical protein
MSVLARRLARLGAKHSAAAVAGAARRELRLLLDEAGVERALRSDRTVIFGPFLGEVGYELLYWRPRILRLLRTRRVAPERAVVVSRGGAGSWYAPHARAIDVLELIDPEELRRHVDDRAARTGQRKQVAREETDDRLLAGVQARVGPADVVHPSVVYNRLRFLWDGLRAPADAPSLGDYDDLPRMDLPPAVADRLPERFVAAKVYFNEALGDDPGTRIAIAERLACELPVVLLQAGVAIDDHVDWDGDGISVADLLEPRTNLAVQAEIVARAERLVATYGGFSYVGPFVGTPTVAISNRREANPHHADVLRAVRPGAAFQRVSV